MARYLRLTDGAEFGDKNLFTHDYEHVSVVAPPASLNPATGNYCYKGAFQGARIIGVLLPGYLRYRMYITNVLYAHGADIFLWEGRCIDNDGNWSYFNQARLTIDEIGRLETQIFVHDDPDSHHWFWETVGLSNFCLNPNRWYLIDIAYGTLGHVFDVKVDGNLMITSAEPTYPSDYCLWVSLHEDMCPGGCIVDTLKFETGAYTTIYIDDIACNDEVGLEDNSWCGDGHMEIMIPNGTGISSEWHGSDGDSVDNYNLVDDAPNDGDLTYVYTNGSGHVDQYALSDLDLTDKRILRIFPEGRGYSNIWTHLGGADYECVSYAIRMGFYTSLGNIYYDEVAVDCGNSYLDPSDYLDRRIGDESWTTNPDDSNPWEESDLDALEFYMRGT